MPNLLSTVTAPRELKQQRSKDKRDALLVAARGLFAEQGFEHTPIADIAARPRWQLVAFINILRPNKMSG